ncbi:MAG: 6-phosphogluconolactonase [Daejeonella sp.]
MELHINTTSDELICEMADYFVDQATKFISSNSVFNVVLSGGNSPKALFKLLAQDSYNKKIDWNKINFFFADERYVPADDPENNSRMAKETLFDPLNIPKNQIFVIDTSLSPEEAGSNYFKTIQNHFNGKKVVFDLILLGLGDNSHTASLFPNTSILADHSISVKAVYLSAEKKYRISMTAGMINQAKNIAFLVYGKSKAAAVKHILKDDFNPNEFPAQLIKPVNGNLEWFIDQSAASELND